jgi:hypothetical protein
MPQEEILPRETARVRKVIQISTIGPSGDFDHPPLAFELLVKSFSGLETQLGQAFMNLTQGQL